MAPPLQIKVATVQMTDQKTCQFWPMRHTIQLMISNFRNNSRLLVVETYRNLSSRHFRKFFKVTCQISSNTICGNTASESETTVSFDVYALKLRSVISRLLQIFKNYPSAVFKWRKQYSDLKIKICNLAARTKCLGTEDKSHNIWQYCYKFTIQPANQKQLSPLTYMP